MQDTVGDQGLTFGSRLRQLREAAGLTQEELALRAGLSPRAISALERGGGNDPTRTLCARSRTRWSSPKKYAPPSWHPCRGAVPPLPPHREQLQRLTSRCPRLLFWGGSGSGKR